ncbi:MAG: FliA/WhiG family RNA polymerase sigma factor [Planctomycetes bacterium]|nr:FliA/WhiG family RNA polymerase sigma factor [Planctomycetota bacterium]MBI3843052.1 FliA/WhiG family RNA polymerase sigma factor [Planctomycetota bacterium]
MTDTAPGYSSAAWQERDHRIIEHIPLVYHVIGRLSLRVPVGLDTEDLVEAGLVGLVLASNSFNPGRGVAFKTFAYACIKGAILDEIRRHDVLSRGEREKLRRLTRAEADIRRASGRQPTPEELAEKLGIPEAELDSLLLVLRTSAVTSLEQSSATSRPVDIFDTRAPDPCAEASLEEEKDRLATAIRNLPDGERKVVLLYYVEGLMLREIGAILGVSESRVSQIHSRALYRLGEIVRPASDAEADDGDSSGNGAAGALNDNGR